MPYTSRASGVFLPHGTFSCCISQFTKSPDNSARLDRATSVSFISVSLEVARRADPSAILAAPDRALWVIWS